MPRPTTAWDGDNRPATGYAGDGFRDGARPAEEVRDTAAEFATAAHTLDGLSLVRRPDAISMSYQVAHTLGPVARSDATGGLVARVWKVRHEAAPGGGRVMLAMATDANDGYEPEVELFTYLGEPIVELDCAFDQSGAPIVVAERAGRLWIYWYDPFAAAQVFEDFGPGRTPRCLLDDPEDVQDSDVVIAYVSDADNMVMYRMQRDRYAVAYATPVVGDAVLTAELTLPPIANIAVEDVVLGEGRRLVITCSLHEGARYRLLFLATTLYPVRDTDSYAAASALTDGELRVVILIATVPEDEEVALALYRTDPDRAEMVTALVAGVLEVAGPLLIAPSDYVDAEGYPTTAFNDGDPVTASVGLPAGRLSDLLIIQEQYEDVKHVSTVTLPTGELLVVVIEHTSYDAQQHRNRVSLVTGYLGA